MLQNKAVDSIESAPDTGDFRSGHLLEMQTQDLHLTDEVSYCQVTHLPMGEVLLKRGDSSMRISRIGPDINYVTIPV